MTGTPPILDRAAAVQFLRTFDHAATRRGKGCYYGGCVTKLEGEPGRAVYTAEVRGNLTYAVTLQYEGGQWSGSCSCPLGARCKHVYAAMQALLDRRTPVASRLPPAPPRMTPLEQRLVEAHGRGLKPDELTFVRGLENLHTRCRRTGTITGWDLQSHGIMSVGYGWGALDLWPAFPKDPLQLWLYIAYALEQRHDPVPPLMAPISNLDSIRPELAAWERRKQVAAWQERLGTAAARAEVQAGGRQTVDFRLRLTREGASLEWRYAEEAGFRRLKRSQFYRFQAEHREGVLDIAPEASALWSWFEGDHAYGSSVDIRLLDADCARRMNRFLRNANLRERIVTVTGAPFLYPTEPLHWEMRPAASEKDDYELRLALPDGSPAPPVFLTAPGNPTLYISAEAVHAGPASAECLSVTGQNSIPAPALESRPGLALLQQLGLPFPPRLAARVRMVKLPVKIICRLGPLYEGSPSEALFLQVVSEFPPGKVSEVFGEAGWTPQHQRADQPAADDGGLIRLFDRAALGAFPRLLEPLSPTWDRYASRWRLRGLKDLPNKFVPWLAGLPKDVQVELDDELATLTKDPVIARVKLECTEAGVDWFDLKVMVDAASTELTPSEMAALLKARGRFVRLGDKGWRRLQFDISEDEDQQLARLGLSPDDFSAEPQRLHALQLADTAAARFLPEAQVAQVRRRAEELKARVSPPLPAAITAALRPYQVDGYHFLAYLSANSFGGILADDMGLGKTLQALCWLAWLRSQENGQHRPSLVVCPKSVMDNWRAEGERFFPELRVSLWRGADAGALPAAVEQSDLLVINYAQLRLLGNELTNVSWLAAILDEGQYIKNPEAITARTARLLKAGHRLALTGTPIENRLLDLWSLMAFAMPGVLGNRFQFARRFNAADDKLARRRLAARVRPFLLRRTKAEVAPDLPERVEEDIICEMEGEQLTFYRAEFKRAKQMLLNIQTNQQLNEFRFHFLTSLLRLRQICCHPALYSEEAKQAPSAKLTALEELLEPLVEEGHKVLVFSQFVTMLDILRETVKAREWPHFYLAGDTENRGELVTAFQSAPGAAVFLMSLKAGGFGLNLTAASYVVLYDPWWNPAVEAQAIDRTHRIGQANKVIAYRLLIKETIEQKMRQLQHQKRELAEDVLGDETFAKSLTLDDLRFLFADNGK